MGVNANKMDAVTRGSIPYIRVYKLPNLPGATVAENSRSADHALVYDVLREQLKSDNRADCSNSDRIRRCSLSMTGITMRVGHTESARRRIDGCGMGYESLSTDRSDKRVYMRALI